jgi:ribosomal protein L7/L12
MMETAPEHVVDLIREGRKIEAVKIVREETGASLKDALQAVEQIERGDRALDLGEDADPMPEVEALVREGRTMEAISVLRRRTGLGLKECKDVVDSLPQPEVAASPRIALVVAAAVLVMGIAIAVLLLTV